MSMALKYHCVCVKIMARRIMLLVPYVDDILLAATDLEMIKVAKQ